jgi:hypothetical protein
VAGIVAVPVEIDTPKVVSASHSGSEKSFGRLLVTRMLVAAAARVAVTVSEAEASWTTVAAAA